MKQFHRGSRAIRFTRSALVGAAALAAVSSARIALADPVDFNPDGTGVSGSIGNAPPIAGHGSGFVMMQPDPDAIDKARFFETGAYQLTESDGYSHLGSHDVTLTYSVFGSIDLSNGALSFQGGIVTLYSDATFNFGTASTTTPIVFGANDGTPIASFSLTAGSGVANDTASLQADAIAGTLLPGYFFTPSGNDAAATQQLQLTVQINNSIDFAPSTAVIAEIVCKAAAFPGPGCTGGSYANTPYYFVVDDRALAMLSTPSAVPEPSSGALVLAGVALIGAIRRKRGVAHIADRSDRAST